MPAYAVTLPYGPARTIKESASVAVLFAATAADARAAAKDLYADGADAQWDNATVTEIAAEVSFAGWSMNVTVYKPGSDMDDPAGVLFTLDIPAPSDGAVAASGAFTMGGDNPSDGDTVEINGVYYAFESGTIDDGDGSMGMPYKVDIGGDAAASLANLRLAINAAGTPGTTYSMSLVAHPDVTAGTIAMGVLPVTAKVAGAAGNAITTTATMTDSMDNVWGAMTLEGGVSDGSIDAWGAAAAVALNDSGHVEDAAYDADTNVLTVAGTANDDLGDHSLVVKITPPGKQYPIPSLVGTIVHEQTANDVLSVELPADDVSVPQAFVFGKRSF